MSATSKERVAQGFSEVKRSFVDTSAHWILMGCSMWMSVDFFHQLGQGTGAIVLGLLAVGFELGRRDAWRRAIQDRSGWMLLLALGLTAFAVTAATSYILDQMEGTKVVQVASGAERVQLEKEISEIDAEIKDFDKKSSALDPTYRTSALEYSKRKEALREKRRPLEAALNSLPTPSVEVGKTLSGKWAVFSRIPDFPFWFWLGAICFLEIGIVATIKRPPTPKKIPLRARFHFLNRWGKGGTVVGQVVPLWDGECPTVGQEVSRGGAEVGRTLKTAFVRPGSPLRGRRELTSLLGVPEREIRRDLEQIQALGLAVPHPGKGLILSVSIEEAVKRLGEINRE